jgi:hypothetical protein
VLGAQVRVVAERGLQLVQRFRRDARVQDPVQAFERIVQALEATDTLVNRQAGSLGLPE